MKTIYKGHEITVTREKSMAGYDMLFYGVFRVSDGYECDSGYSDSNETVKEFTAMLKERVDAELAEDAPWCERESEGEFDEVTTDISEFDTPTLGPLMVEASGDPDYPFCVCPVDSDGIQLPPVAQFEKHADALRFVMQGRWTQAKPANEGWYWAERIDAGLPMVSMVFVTRIDGTCTHVWSPLERKEYGTANFDWWQGPLYCSPLPEEVKP